MSGSLAKAYLEPEQGDLIYCLFTPAELSISKSTQWSPTKGPGKNAPKLKFTQGQPGTMSLNLTFDTTDKGEPVTKHTNALLSLLAVNPSLRDTDAHNNSARPPSVVFHWGRFHSFKAIVEKIDVKFTYFAQDGTPLRAKATIAMKQYQEEEAWGAQNPTSGTPRTHSLHQVAPGETLDRIAAMRYGDPSRWRLLAEANSIVDPFDLDPGTQLVVPDMMAVRRG
jgi:nucleoid-associated protein YgaU